VKTRGILSRAAGIAALILVVGAVVVYLLQPATINAQPDRFTVGTAIFVVGYLLFPVLAILFSWTAAHRCHAACASHARARTFVAMRI
jgi:hypothetical protein